MRIIALSTLKTFLESDPAYVDAREPTMAWYRQVRAAHWATPTDVKRGIGTASILKDGRAVFNRVVYIRFIGTHRQYDKIDAQTV